MKAKQLMTTTIAGMVSTLTLTALVAAQRPMSGQMKSMGDMAKISREKLAARSSIDTEVSL